MAEAKTHYTARELAGLPGLPGTERRVRSKAEREGWPSRQRTGRGGGCEYPITALPDATREHLLGALMTVATETLPAVIPATLPVPVAPHAVQDLADLKTWQQRRMDARLAFVRVIERAAVTVGVNQAVATLVEQSKAGTLPEQLQGLVMVANARSGSNGERALSRRTLLRWWSEYKAAGGNYAALAPAKAERNELPPWATLFLKVYRVPQKISVSMAVRDLEAILPPGTICPSESQVRRFLKKYSRLDIQRGRKSGAELRGQRLYRERDTTELLPTDIFVCDGHSFKAYVAHPGTGRPFHPEVCAVLDVATRMVVGWSAGLAESSFTVADALRHAVTVTDEKRYGGLPTTFYTDNGGGNTAKVNADEVAGLYARLGIVFNTGRAGNPQGRGIIERLNATLWIPAAKRLPTFTGAGMDSLMQRQVYLTLDKAVRASRRNGLPTASELLIAWPDFLAFMAAAIEEYNNRPHSYLPRITCPATGLRRDMTPREYWESFVAKGWQPVLLDQDEKDHLFMPHTTAKVSRGMIRLFKHVYSDPALEHYHGMEMLVGYDIHDPSRIKVRDSEGRLIVIAKRDAHKSSFMALPVIEQRREQRYKNRKRAIDRKMEEIELERRGSGVIEVKAIELAPELVERTDRLLAKVEQKKRTFASSWERYEDISVRAANGEASEYELAWKKDYEAFTETGKRSGLFRADEFCLKESAAGVAAPTAG